ncbi:MAG: hypothetical protein ACO3C1_09610 [Ilumatobacteraceae bacterium]
MPTRVGVATNASVTSPAPNPTSASRTPRSPRSHRATALRPTGRSRTQWLAMGAALVVLAGVLVAWALSSAGRRVLVVQVAQPVAAGSVIDAADLVTTGVAFDPGVEGLVPAASLDVLIGRIAAVDLEQGVLLQRGMWRDGESLAEGEQAVGAVLDAGRFPLGLGVGDVVLGAPLGAAALAVGDGAPSGAPADATGSVGDDASPAVTMRVTDLVALDNGSVSVSFAVAARDAVLVAQLSATGQLVVVRLPSGDTAPRSSSPTTSTEEAP